MTDQTVTSARERIREAVYEAMDYADARHGYEAPGEWDRREDKATDRIIAIVREAMLSDEVVGVLATEIKEYDMGYRLGLSYALEAAFGEERSDE